MVEDIFISRESYVLMKKVLVLLCAPRKTKRIHLNDLPRVSINLISFPLYMFPVIIKYSFCLPSAKFSRCYKIIIRKNLIQIYSRYMSNSFRDYFNFINFKKSYSFSASISILFI